jgi:TraY domain-containing protein
VRYRYFALSCSAEIRSEDMARRKAADEKREQLSVGVEEELKRRLEEAARISARSLSGEALFRLRRSFQQEPEAA